MSTLYRSLDNSPSGQIIKLLQRNGALGVKELRRELGLSDTAMRQQLGHLMAEGFVMPTTAERNGVGRPQQRYQLSDKARELFACYCEDLALNLYDELLADQGTVVVRALLNRVGDKLAGQYRQQVRGQALQERVSSFARILDSKGILADVSHEADVITLHEFNCPYHELASVHREICNMEKTMMAQVLNANVELTHCMMDGHNGCSFVVSNL
ncbi:MAG: methanogen output domain 1-containing protein [Caldilineales bacterium]|nr:methanogen output domain 1-containing protein [Caldilineales bacterium]MCW5856806.1 winged helix-turn-helix transcriptional regulator [Caldilineales bacterium]